MPPSTNGSNPRQADKPVGVIPLASSDTVGTLTSCAWDAAAMFQVLAGHDQEDLTTVAADVPDYAGELTGTLDGVKIGVPRKYFHDNVDPEVEEAFSRFLDELAGAGCSVKDVNLEGVEKVYPCWLTIRRAEATAFHLRWLESTPEAYGEDVRRSLELGKEISAVEYVNAQDIRPALMESFMSSMKGIDALAIPSTSITAPRIGQQVADIGGREIDVYSALNRLTLPFNVVGFPAISVPASLVQDLPVGAQLVTGPFEEPKLLRLAHALERRGPYPAPSQIV